MIVEYPGRTNPDSQYQLIQVQISSVIDDWHGPAVTRLWSLLGPIFGYPASALLVNSLPLGLFAGFVPGLGRPNAIGLAIWTADLAFKLSLVSLAGMIFPDMLLTFVLLILICLWDRRASAAGQVRLTAIMIALAFIACLVRPSNFLAGIVAASIFVAVRYRPDTRAVKRLGLVVAGFLLMLRSATSSRIM